MRHIYYSDPDLTKGCEGFIEDLKEAILIKVMQQQKGTFERLLHRKQNIGKNYDKSGHSKQVKKTLLDQNTSKW